MDEMSREKKGLRTSFSLFSIEHVESVCIEKGESSKPRIEYKFCCGIHTGLEQFVSFGTNHTREDFLFTIK